MTTGLMPLLGLALATISFVGNILICALPQWRATELLYEVDPFECHCVSDVLSGYMEVLCNNLQCTPNSVQKV